ncbi:ATP-binding protein [Sphingomonas sp. PAMC 26621]|uniref:ATP-binding protein n=1 Tax=Sphingomonas sp. PAMC 26621 TaxID=1112213 RepID=UPI0002888EFC|nr:ATP-binding protein [Sphingomonas sp. PAMC 26621]
MNPALSTEELLATFHADDDAELAPTAESLATRDAFLDAAAMLHLFRPNELNAGMAAGTGANHVVAFASPAVGWSTERLWTLSTSARRTAIRRMATRDSLRRARRLNNPPADTVVQQMLDRWLDGRPLVLEKLSAAELDALRTIGEWGLADLPGFPDAGRIGAAWRRRGLVADFEGLANRFVGRRKELARLRSFLLEERASAGRRGKGARSLFLKGPGGVGKSALVARVVLDFFDEPEAAALPFLYVTFDDPAINPAEPQTLIGAALLQLEAQVASLHTDQAADEARQAVAELRDRMSGHTRARRRLNDRAIVATSQRGRIGQLRQLDDELGAAFAETLNRLASLAGDGPTASFLFVLDTFEEASYHPDSDLWLLYNFLADLGERVPTLRLLMVGRAEPDGAQFHRLGADALSLGDLDQADALAFLKREGLSPDAAARVTAQLGTNPLTLKLCVRALRDKAVGDALPGEAIASAGQEVIRGYLYRRILNHIHDPIVRRLAHPGMVLRRVTADIITEVLAPVCDVPVHTPEAAQALLDGLAREHSLVSRAPDGALVYREEVRRPMLALIEADAPDEVRSLHEAAYSYYRWSEEQSESDRVEALYHRLMLPHPEWAAHELSLSSRLASTLAGTLDELPQAGRIALAAFTRVKLDGNDRQAANAEEEERLLGREVLAAIRSDAFDEALAMLDRQIAPGSGLAPLRVRILIGLNRHKEAARYATEQLALFPALGDRTRHAELLWFGAQASGSGPAAAEMLRRLVPVAARLSPITEVQALAELVSVAEPEQAEAARERLGQALATLDLNAAFNEATLVRLALARVGPAPWSLWTRFAKLLAYDLAYRIASRPSDILSTLRVELLEVLEGAADPDLGKAHALLADRHLESRVAHLIELVVGALQKTDGDVRAAVAAHRLCITEGTTLAAAALAGLEGRRERWETDSASESVA